jgi:glutathione S-transferase
MKQPKLTLISHHLCPFVQRAAIALLEKGVDFERKNIDLANKPDWFLKLSPLGKVPILVIDDETVLFESSVIAQYANEITGGDLLSADTAEKYRQLAWMEFASQVIGSIGQLYNADDEAAFDLATSGLTEKFSRVEEALSNGPWFSGEDFSLVDAAFAPAFRYFDVIDELTSIDFFANTPKVAAWRKSLQQRPSVIGAVSDDYPERLLTFFADRNTVIGRLAQNQAPVVEAAA